MDRPRQDASTPASSITSPRTLYEGDGDDSDDGSSSNVVWGVAPNPYASLNLDDLNAQLGKEQAIAEGADALLGVFETESSNEASKVELKQQVEQELAAANLRIQEILGWIARAERLHVATYDADGQFSLTVDETVEPSGADVEKPFVFARSSDESQYVVRSSLSSLLAFRWLISLPERPVLGGHDIDSFMPTFELVISLLQKLDELEEAAERLKAMDQIVENLLREVRVKYEIKLEDHLASIMDGLSDHATKEVRAGSYRLLRHLIVDQHDVYQLHACYLDIFLVRSLARDHKSDIEKEQALRLVRLLLSLPDTERPVQPAVIRSIVAIAENQEEKLRLACLETLGELLIRDVSLLAAAEGLRVVLQALTDGPYDLAPFLSMGLLWVMDKPETRQYLRPGVDVEIVLAGFTEVQGKGSVPEERVRATSKMVATALKSWSGIMYLNLDGKRALRSIVESLTNPSPIIRDSLLDMLFNVLHIEMPAWYTSAAGNRLSGLRRKHVPPVVDVGELHAQPKRQCNLIDHYLSVVLLVFIDAGLIEALVSIASIPQDPKTSRKISLLISEILLLSNRVLPLSHATRVQTLPRLFSLASSFDTSDARLAAGSTLLVIDQFNREKIKAEHTSDNVRLRSNSIEDPLARGQRQVESTKVKMGMSIDDATFRNMLLKSRVLETKDDTKWDFDTLMDLLEGPLLNPKRLDEAMRASKFMKRLLSFFQPFSLRYSDMKKDRYSVKYSRLGCALLETLLANPDGIRYLTEDKLMRQIADALAQLDAIGGPPATELLFSKSRMDTTLCAGYFEMLGILTRSTEGTKLLDQMKIFTLFYRISELRDRDDLVEAILETVDYSRDGHPRVFLSKALTSSHKNTRIFATRHLARLTKEAGVVAHEWQLRLLLTQLYDPASEVCELTVSILEQVCQSPQTLEIVVQMRPCLDHIGEIGAGLLTRLVLVSLELQSHLCIPSRQKLSHLCESHRFLSTSIGVSYLHEIEFISRKLDDWYNFENLNYVIDLELALSQALRIDQFDLSLPTSTRFDGTPPAHFYGELVKTSEGCAMLDDCEHFLSFSEYVRTHSHENQDPDIILNLKAVLWCIGHIGSTTGGLEFLDEEFIIPLIVEIAEDSEVYSLRGTAYFVLGLIASTLEGVEMLEEVGWESVTTPLGGATGLCVPKDLANFVDISQTSLWSPPIASSPESLLLTPPTSPHEIEFLTSLSNLSNHILATKASKTLTRLKLKHRTLFSDTAILYRTLEMLANRSYRLSIRNYIFDLFEFDSFDLSFVLKMMQVGEELKIDNDHRDQDEDEEDEFISSSQDQNRYDRVSIGKKQKKVVSSHVGTPKVEKGVRAILGKTKGIGGEDDSETEVDQFSEDDDNDEGGDEKLMIPVQICQPLLSVKGFLLN